MKPDIISIISILVLTFGLSCSRSGQHERQIKDDQRSRVASNESTVPAVSERTAYSSGKNVIIMREEHNTFYLPIKVNGIPMEFIFDTGASIISISLTETLFLLKQGLLYDDDFLGETRFSDATGTISEGTLLNLREVQIGTKTIYNVRASIVHNLEAPLLLGQSALNQFGTVTIDYRNNKLILD